MEDLMHKLEKCHLYTDTVFAGIANHLFSSVVTNLKRTEFEPVVKENRES